MSVSLLLISEDNNELEILNSINIYSMQCDKIMVLNNPINREFDFIPLGDQGFSIVSSVNEFIECNLSDFLVISRVGYEINLNKVIDNISSSECFSAALYADNYFNLDNKVSLTDYTEIRIPDFSNTSIIIKKEVIESFATIGKCDLSTFENIIFVRSLIIGDINLLTHDKKTKTKTKTKTIKIYDVGNISFEVLKADLILIEEGELLKDVDFTKLVDFNKVFRKLTLYKFPNSINKIILQLILRNVNILKYIKNDIYENLKYYYKDFINIVKYTFLKRDEVLFAFFTSKYPKHMNWGDDINYFILSKATNRKIIKLNRIGPENVILPIGSIIQFIPKNIKVDIYGAGLISDDATVNIKNIKSVKFVRGPSTRDKLIKLGVRVPESYGDLGLLISDYYRPKIKIKHDIGFIPHYTEKNSDFTLHCKKIGVKIIDVQQGHKDFIDELLSCENIISSSLHGLIASDSYSIPNKWIKLSARVLGDGFKFDDYHNGILAKNFLSYTPNCSESLASLIAICSEKIVDCSEITRIKNKMKVFLQSV